MKRYRRLRRLRPDAELYRRRAAGESVRALAPDYGVVHTTLSRHFARPQAAAQVKQAGRLLRAERRALAARAQRTHRAEPSRASERAAGAVEAGGGIQAVIEATGLRTLKNVLGLSDPAVLVQAFANDAARARGPRLRRLRPDADLYRRRVEGESLRALARDYGVVHTTLSRHFARAQAAKELKRAERSLRAERRAAAAHLRAEQKAEREARQRAKEQTEREARRSAEQQRASVSERLRLGDGSANTGRSRYVPPLELKPFSNDWLAWYAARRLRSEIDMLNDNDARRGIVPPL